jgi:hypothetical protein
MLGHSRVDYSRSSAKIDCQALCKTKLWTMSSPLAGRSRLSCFLCPLQANFGMTSGLAVSWTLSCPPPDGTVNTGMFIARQERNLACSQLGSIGNSDLSSI